MHSSFLGWGISASIQRQKLQAEVTCLHSWRASRQTWTCGPGLNPTHFFVSGKCVQKPPLKTVVLKIRSSVQGACLFPALVQDGTENVYFSLLTASDFRNHEQGMFFFIVCGPWGTLALWSLPWLGGKRSPSSIFKIRTGSIKWCSRQVWPWTWSPNLSPFAWP